MPNTKSLATQIAELQAEIDEKRKQLGKLQAQCTHPAEAVNKKHDRSRGEVLVSEIEYWTNFHCTICDKRWTKDGSH